MSFRKLTHGTNYFLLAAMVLGILGLLNYFGTAFFKRWDLTEQQLFTISEPTRKILSNLDDVVSIKVYFSRDLPPYITPLSRQVKDMLQEYLAYAGNKLAVEFKDPAQDPALERRVRQLGIPRVQLNIIEKDQAQVRNAYLGIAVFYEDKKEVIPIVQDTSTLEYELTAAIKKVTIEVVKTIGWLVPEDEESLRQYNFIFQFLSKEYNFQLVRNLAQKSVPAEVDTLVVPPQVQFSERAKYELDQFLMRGGKLFLLVNPIKFKPRSMEISLLQNNLQELLQHYGVKQKNELALDKVNARASFSQGFMSFSMPYPFWVKVTKKGFANHPALKHLERVVFPWATPLEVLEKKNIKATILARTSPYAWTRSVHQYMNLAPQQRFRPPKKPDSYPLAVLLNGEFESFYAGKEAPARTSEQESKKDNKQAPKPAAEEEKPLLKSPKTQIIVVGNGRFLKDNFLRMFRSNRLFFLNLMDWLNVGDELIQVRARQVDERPLREISEEEKSYLRFLNIFAMPLLIIIFGLARYRFRRRAQRLYETGLSAGTNESVR